MGFAPRYPRDGASRTDQKIIYLSLRTTELSTELCPFKIRFFDPDQKKQNKKSKTLKMEENMPWWVAEGFTERQMELMENDYHVHMIRRGIRYMCNAFNSELSLLKRRITTLERMQLSTHYKSLIQQIKQELTTLESNYNYRCKHRSDLREFEESRADTLRSFYKRIVYLNKRFYREFGSLLMEEVLPEY